MGKRPVELFLDAYPDERERFRRDSDAFDIAINRVIDDAIIRVILLELEANKNG